jgi:MFS family permease
MHLRDLITDCSDIAIEIPSNIVLKVVGGKIWIPVLVFGFGIVSLCTAFVHSYSGLLAVRFILGICEGGVLPGIAYYLSTFYRRTELLFRVSIFIMGSSLAGAFGGLLAAALTQIPEWGTSAAPIHTWRNIFFFEGLVSVLAAFVGFLILPNSPMATPFLTDRERQIAIERMHREYRESTTERIKLHHVKKAIFSVHGTLCAFMFFFLNVALQSFSVFLPTILRDLGYTALQAQLRSVAPYVAACALAIGIAWLSDRAKMRGPFVLGCSVISAIGYIILVVSDNASAKYAAIFIAAMGMFAAGPATVSWGLNNAAGPSVRAVTSAYVVSVGNCGALVATWTYLPFMAPRYTLGHALNLTSVGCAAVLSTVGFLYCTLENRKRERGDRDHILVGKSEQEIEQLGSLHPKFRLMR